MAMRQQASRLQTNALAVIGIVLWTGVLLFGAVIAFIHARTGFPVKAQPMSLRYAEMAFSAVAVAVALVRRGRVGRAVDGAERNNQVLQVWAIGDGAALFGGVLFLLTNEAQWYGLGLLAMLTTFILVPLRRSA